VSDLRFRSGSDEADVTRGWAAAPEFWLFVALWIGVQLLWAAVRFPVALGGGQIDPDGYMRLVMVERLLETGDWYGGVIERSNWPFGEDHHWTRPLDVLIVLLAFPFRAFLDGRSAIGLSGSLISPLLHLLTCLAAVWVVRPLVPGRERFLVLPAMLVQLVLLAFGSAGRADHHALILLLMLLSTGTWLRALLDPHALRWAGATGGILALSTWVSPEALLPLGLVFASGGVAWVLDGHPRERQNRVVATALLVGLAAAILLQKPPGAWLEVVYDQVALPHVTMAAVALAFWMCAGLARDRRPRIGFAIVGAPVAFLLMAGVHPDFFRGPWADTDPVVMENWLQHVYELHPLFPRGPEGLGSFLMVLAGPIALIPFVLSWSWGERSSVRGQAWLYLGISLAVYVVLASWQTRFGAYSGVISALVSVEAIRRARGLLGRRMVPRVGATAAILIGPLVLGALVQEGVGLLRAGPGETGQASGASVTVAMGASCPLEYISRVLDDPEGLGNRPRTVAAFLDFGPELLYRTRHRVLAGPYHRNYPGILDTWRMLTSLEADLAWDLVQEREVDLILLCPARDDDYFGAAEGNTVYRRLIEGDPPVWARPLEIGRGLDSAFLLFEVGPGDPNEPSVAPPN
jgi:hypothetical protein